MHNTNLLCVKCQTPLRESGKGINILNGPGIECVVCHTQYLADFILREGSSKPVLVLQPLPEDWEQRYNELQEKGGPLFGPDPYAGNGYAPQDFPPNTHGIDPRQINPHFQGGYSGSFNDPGFTAHKSSKLVGKERSTEEFKKLIKESLSPSEFIKKISSAE